MAEQDSRRWIKQRMTMLRKQAAINFHHDIFISILLCLISGKHKHLVLIAPVQHIPQVAQMATEICRSLFGFTTANINCQSNPSVTSFIHDLFISANNDEEDFPPSTNRQMANFGRTSIYDNDILKKQPSTSQYPNTSPINPLDFTVRPSKSFSFIPKQHQQQQKQFINDNQRKYSTTSGNGNIVSTSGTNRLAQALIVQYLNDANELIQAALLELIINKEIKLNTTRYTTPRPHFLTIAIIPETSYHNTVSSHLLDHFFLSYRFKEEFFQNSNSTPNILNLLSNDTRSKSQTYRRMALFQNEEIKSLADYASKIHINIDITRYIRDIIVGIRTHHLVQGGLTARTSQDLVIVTRSLAAVFKKKFLTPDLVAVAVEKVIGHRLRIKTNNQSKDNNINNNINNNAIADVVSDVLRIVYAPV
ncbi:unnamed protein product [Cunninghamella blakesleeana]